MNHTPDPLIKQQPLEKVVLCFSKLLVRMTLAIGVWQIRNAERRLRYRLTAELGLRATYLLADVLGVVVRICWRAQRGRGSGGVSFETPELEVRGPAALAR
jgi:hypothetical protein